MVKKANGEMAKLQDRKKLSDIANRPFAPLPPIAF